MEAFCIILFNQSQCRWGSLYFPAQVQRPRFDCMFFAARMHWVEGCYHTPLWLLACPQSWVQKHAFMLLWVLERLRQSGTELFPIRMLSDWRAGGPHSHPCTPLFSCHTFSNLTWSSKTFFSVPLTQFFKTCIYKGCGGMRVELVWEGVSCWEMP